LSFPQLNGNVIIKNISKGDVRFARTWNTLLTASFAKEKSHSFLDETTTEATDSSMSES